MRAMAEVVSCTSWPKKRIWATEPPASSTSAAASMSMPPEPTAGSYTVSVGPGSRIFVRRRTTERGVKNSPAFLPDASANCRSRYS